MDKKTPVRLADNASTEAPIDISTSDAPTLKAALRQQYASQRLARPEDTRTQDDAARQERVLALLNDTFASHTGVTVSIYLSQPPEPSTTALAKILHETGWHVIVPSPGRDISPWGEPAWTWYDEPTQPRPPGIPVAPDWLLQAELAAADVIIMPGLAGTRDGTRLGRGGGWYDKALMSAWDGTPRWLLLNDDEVVDELPAEPHDVTVDLIITPSGVIVCGP